MPDCPKSSFRTALSAKRTALTHKARADMERTILSRLLESAMWQNAPLVCGYVSTRGELDLSPVWQAAVSAGKTYALPVTAGGTAEGRMFFRATPDFCPARLVRGRFGIFEPPDAPDFPVLPLDALRGALLLVPGLGFDDDGFRIGYGGGYYDRFLDTLAAAEVSVCTVGLCPAVCRVGRLPREAHDRPVTCVIDDR